MKKFFFFSLLSIALIAFGCGGGDSSKTDDSKKEADKTTDITKHPDYAKGSELEAKQDCKTCHAIDVKITGPSFQDIANKYASAGDTIVTHLAQKVISGGTGVWGTIAMLPHSNISQADAEAIVKYILLFKTQQ